MAGEIAAGRVRVGDRHAHLADAVDQRHAHGHQGGAIAIMQVEIIVIRPLTLFDLQAQGGVEGFLAGAADPEEALAGLGHLDHALFHGACLEHDAVQLPAAFGRQELLARGGAGQLAIGGPVRQRLVGLGGRHASSSHGRAAGLVPAVHGGDEPHRSLLYYELLAYCEQCLLPPPFQVLGQVIRQDQTIAIKKDYIRS